DGRAADAHLVHRGLGLASPFEPVPHLLVAHGLPSESLIRWTARLTALARSGRPLAVTDLHNSRRASRSRTSSRLATSMVKSSSVPVYGSAGGCAGALGRRGDGAARS